MFFFLMGLTCDACAVAMLIKGNWAAAAFFSIQAYRMHLIARDDDQTHED